MINRQAITAQPTSAIRGDWQMATRFNKVSGVEVLDSLLEQSQSETVILFNHDPYCPISARAFGQMEKFDGDVALIDVSREKSLTREIQGRTGVRHESPQVIVLRDGRPTWSASHFQITADAVQEAASEND
jgi:bacillithiol system protein YtxJ